MDSRASPHKASEVGPAVGQYPASPAGTDPEKHCQLLFPEAYARRQYQDTNEVVSDGSDDQSETWSVVRAASHYRAMDATSAAGDWTVLEVLGMSLNEEADGSPQHPESVTEETWSSTGIEAVRGANEPQAVIGAVRWDDEPITPHLLSALKPMGCDQLPHRGNGVPKAFTAEGPPTYHSSQPIGPSEHQREQQCDADSLRILEHCTRMWAWHAASKPPRPGSRLEAQSDAESLKMLEYWTQKRAVEMSWAAA